MVGTPYEEIIILAAWPRLHSSTRVRSSPTGCRARHPKSDAKLPHNEESLWEEHVWWEATPELGGEASVHGWRHHHSTMLSSNVGGNWQPNSSGATQSPIPRGQKVLRVGDVHMEMHPKVCQHEGRKEQERAKLPTSNHGLHPKHTNACGEIKPAREDTRPQGPRCTRAGVVPKGHGSEHGHTKPDWALAEPPR